MKRRRRIRGGGGGGGTVCIPSLPESPDRSNRRWDGEVAAAKAEPMSETDLEGSEYSYSPSSEDPGLFDGEGRRTRVARPSS
eukprot:1764813-Pyramimonas_sp.AAC.1